MHSSFRDIKIRFSVHLGFMHIPFLSTELVKGQEWADARHFFDKPTFTSFNTFAMLIPQLVNGRFYPIAQIATETFTA